MAAEWAFHNAIPDAKDQVKAQYDDDLDEYAAMGLTKSQAPFACCSKATKPPAESV